MAVADEMIRLEKGKITEQISLNDPSGPSQPDSLSAPGFWRKVMRELKAGEDG